MRMRIKCSKSSYWTSVPTWDRLLKSKPCYTNDLMNGKRTTVMGNMMMNNCPQLKRKQRNKKILEPSRRLPKTMVMTMRVKKMEKRKRKPPTPRKMMKIYPTLSNQMTKEETQPLGHNN